jgi:LytTr DNA-binding domain
MLESLARPWSFRMVALTAIGVVAANTLYCLVYTSLAGRPESVGQAIGWSVANLLPWLFAFEAGKRWQRPFTAVAGAMLLSLLLGAALIGGEPGLFELARRVPGAAVTLAVLMIVQRRQIRTEGGAVALPLPPERIAWVAAAGNYVELHGGERPLLVRAPLGAVEATLKPHGFVRIHRSTLVNRRRVAKVRSVDLLLDNGRSLKLGASFRAQLLA